MLPEEFSQIVYFRDIQGNKNIVGSLGITIIILLFYFFAWSVPSNFPVGSIYTLSYGSTLSSTAVDLKADHTIRSAFWFKSFLYVFSLGSVKIVAGDYNLAHTENVITLAWRITHGSFDIVPIKITIPEGLNSTEIAAIYAKNLPHFDATGFVSLVKSENLEGYIFPDTYLFTPGMTNKDIIQKMNNTFTTKIQTVASQIQAFGKTQSDVIRMASIIEDEARTDDSRKMVAGILWRRLALGMPLQVDSSFRYINGKASSQLTVVDLQMDSPYNSYTHKGLPPTPISNPGLASILDAVTPTKSSYLYFLSDKEGNMHYATTFTEQLANEQKYLK